MILPESFSTDWIISHRNRAGFEKINPPLAEKMIHALGLVEALANSQLNFVFKGGTSLILLLSTPGRFSIDIDIITQAERAEVEKALDEICNGIPFTGYKLNAQRSYQPGIPKAHYSLLYNSGLTGKEEHVLLDILYDKHSYPQLLDLPVETEWVKTEGKVIYVKVPTHESITGDKMTAFAPNTTGILYNKGKELEIVKQMYDLGRLFHEVKNIVIVRDAFDQTVNKEILYRGNTHSRENVLDDIIDTALTIAKRDKNKADPYLSNFKEIQTGLLQFKAYQMTSFFRIDEAITSAAKAALMAAKIKVNAEGQLDLYQMGMDKKDYLIEHPEYVFLNKLPIESLFYWKQVIDLLFKQP